MTGSVAATVTLGSRWLVRLSDEPPPATSRTNHQAADSAAHDPEDMGAFEPFVRAHEPQILNYLWRLTGDEQTAYDLTQEVFLRAWQHYATVSHYEQPRGWLFRVATNLALSANATRRRRGAITPAPSAGMLEGDDAPGSSDIARRIVERDTMRAVLLQLSPKRRAALVLREVYGLSTAEVGEALGMSEPAVRMALSRAREQFRELYARENRQEGDL